MSMKRVVMGLVVVLALGMFVVPSHAFLFGGCGSSSSCTPCAPYLVTVQYDPIQPQPGECTYCTCLPYGCPDGAPLASCPPGGGGGCGGSCCGGGGLGLGGLFGGGGGCGLDLGGLLCAPGSIICCATGLVGNVLDCAVSTVGGLLGGLCCSGGGGGCCNAGPIGQ